MTTTTVTSTNIPAARWIARGFTDDVTECEHCGRVELKGTVRLEAITPDGDSDGEIYAGVVCAARLSGRRAAEIRTEAARADRARIQAIRDAHRAWSDAHSTFTCGMRDAEFTRRGYGRWDRQPLGEIWAYYDSPEFKTAEAAWLAEHPEPQRP